MDRSYKPPHEGLIAMGVAIRLRNTKDNNYFDLCLKIIKYTLDLVFAIYTRCILGSVSIWFNISCKLYIVVLD